MQSVLVEERETWTGNPDSSILECSSRKEVVHWDAQKRDLVSKIIGVKRTKLVATDQWAIKIEYFFCSEKLVTRV